MARFKWPKDDTKDAIQPATTFVINDEDNVYYAASMARKAANYLEKGKVKAAQHCLRLGLERAPDHPECLSYLAICVAMEKKQYQTAEQLAQRILLENPKEARGFYALGRVNLLGSRRRVAFRNFRKAYSLAGRDEGLKRELESMDPRRPPVLASLPRNHFLNAWLGKLRYRILKILNWA